MLDRGTLVENLRNVVLILDTVGAVSAARDVRDAIVEINRPMLAWSSEKPTIPGWYFWRWPTEDGFDEYDSPVRVRESDLKAKTWYIEGHQYAGPFIAVEPTTESEDDE